MDGKFFRKLFSNWNSGISSLIKKLLASVKAEKSDDESGSRLLFSVFPEGNDGYELLIDYRICVDDVEEFVMLL